MTHFANDQLLASTFGRKGDIFTEITAEWLNKDPATVSPEERSHTKHICYGILYGMGPNTLAKDLDISKENAKKFIASFKARYPG